MLKRKPGSALLLFQQKKLSFHVCLAGSDNSQIRSQSYPPGTPAELHLKSPGQEGRGFPTEGSLYQTQKNYVNCNDGNFSIITVETFENVHAITNKPVFPVYLALQSQLSFQV